MCEYHDLIMLSVARLSLIVTLQSHKLDGVGLDLDQSLTIAHQPTVDSTYRESENKAVEELRLMLQNN